MSKTELTQAFLKHRYELTGYLSRQLRCVETANDIYHEVYLRALRVEDPSSVRNLRSYLFKIASNLVKDHVRNENRRAEILDENSSILKDEDKSFTPEDIVLSKNELDYLMKIMSTLPEKSRHIFYEHRFEGKTRQEIADKFDVSLTTVENHIKYVLECLKDARKKTP